MFVYVLLKFDWLIIFFLKNQQESWKFSTLFLSSFSVRFLKCHDCACSVLKSGGNFCPRGKFNLMENNLKTILTPYVSNLKHQCMFKLRLINLYQILFINVGTWNLHWRYYLINGHIILSDNLFCSAYCSMDITKFIASDLPLQSLCGGWNFECKVAH